MKDIMYWCREHKGEELCEHDALAHCKEKENLQKCLEHFKLEVPSKQLKKKKN